MSTRIEHEVVAEFAGVVMGIGNDPMSHVIVRVGKQDIHLPIRPGKVEFDDILIISIARMTP